MPLRPVHRGFPTAISRSREAVSAGEVMGEYWSIVINVTASFQLGICKLPYWLLFLKKDTNLWRVESLGMRQVTGGCSIKAMCLWCNVIIPGEIMMTAIGKILQFSLSTPTFGFSDPKCYSLSSPVSETGISSSYQFIPLRFKLVL